MSTTKRVVNNIFWLVLSEVSSRAIIFLGTIYLARVLGKAGFGLYSLFLAVATYFWAIADLGVTGYGTREIARNKNEPGQLYIILNSLRFFLSMLLFLILCVALYFINIPFEKKLVLLAGAFYAVTYSISSDWIFRGLEKMQFIMLGRFITSLCFVVGIFVLVKAPSDSFLASIIYSSSFLMGSLTFIFILRQKFKMPFFFRISFTEWWHHIKESMFFAINGIFYSVAVFIPVLFMGVWNSNEELGIFSAPHRITLMVINTGALVTLALYPTLSNLFISDKVKFKRVFLNFRDAIISITLPFCIVLTILNKDIILFFFGASYIESAKIFNVLIWLIFLTIMKRTHSIALFSADLHRFNMFATGAGVLLVVLISFVLIPKYSGYGAAWALIIGETFTLILLSGLLIRKVYSSDFFSSYIIKALFASAVMFFLIIKLPFPEILNILIGIVIYGILSLSLGIISKETIYQVYQKVVRS